MPKIKIYYHIKHISYVTVTLVHINAQIILTITAFSNKRSKSKTMWLSVIFHGSQSFCDAHGLNVLFLWEQACEGQSTSVLSSWKHVDSQQRGRVTGELLSHSLGFTWKNLPFPGLSRHSDLGTKPQFAQTTYITKRLKLCGKQSCSSLFLLPVWSETDVCACWMRTTLNFTLSLSLCQTETVTGSWVQLHL